MSSRFVIFSTARSGTSLLAETLNKHPEIYCHGEIFHGTIEWHIRQEYRDRFDVSTREADPVAFCYSVLEFSNGRSAVGFKMWMSQSEKAALALLHDPTVKKIILERENKLAQYSSWTLAIQTGIWNVTTQEGQTITSPRAEKILFSTPQFARFVEQENCVYRTYNEQAVGEVLRLNYADVARLEFAPIYDFLEVQPVETIAAKAKLYSSDILDRFETKWHESIKQSLDQLGHPEWAAEHL